MAPVAALPTLHIALLGAPGTGKTQLAGELAAALARRPALRVLFQIADNPALATVLPTGSAQTPGRRGFDQVLLMGLDLPARAGNRADEAADQRLREALGQAGLPYTVVYGTGPARVASAIRALGGWASPSAAEPPPGAVADERHPWRWACDKCSDPLCERHLLSELLARP